MKTKKYIPPIMLKRILKMWSRYVNGEASHFIYNSVDKSFHKCNFHMYLKQYCI